MEVAASTKGAFQVTRTGWAVLALTILLLAWTSQNNDEKPRMEQPIQPSIIAELREVKSALGNVEATVAEIKETQELEAGAKVAAATTPPAKILDASLTNEVTEDATAPRHVAISGLIESAEHLGEVLRDPYAKNPDVVKAFGKLRQERLGVWTEFHRRDKRLVTGVDPQRLENRFVKPRDEVKRESEVATPQNEEPQHLPVDVTKQDNLSAKGDHGQSPIRTLEWVSLDTGESNRVQGNWTVVK